MIQPQPSKKRRLFWEIHNFVYFSFMSSWIGIVLWKQWPWPQYKALSCDMEASRERKILPEKVELASGTRQKKSGETFRSSFPKGSKNGILFLFYQNSKSKYASLHYRKLKTKLTWFLYYAHLILQRTSLFSKLYMKSDANYRVTDVFPQIWFDETRKFEDLRNVMWW